MRTFRVIGWLILMLCALGPLRPLAAQTARPAQTRARTAAAPAPAPIAPATITRTPDGAVTVRAVRISEALKLDGRLDEAIYRDTPSFGDFVQQDPVEGAPATEKTEAWIFFDNDNIYISARCWDSHPEREIANEMRRDSQGLSQNEHFIVMLDTFNDKRNSVFFQTTPLAAQRDVATTDEINQNNDWNAVWNVKTGRFDHGWTAEIEIPFKSLRYTADPVQIWGVQIRRTIRWKNEWTFLTPVPSYLGPRGIVAASLAAQLVGLETPAKALNLDIKPYAISGTRTDHNSNPPFSNRIDRDIGLDAKYGITKSLTLDLSYNPDFAQVEDDTQQVNLTRFNQSFPERREFFLEGQGIFAFGPGGSNTPVLFFSRRIGLSNGRAVPIAGGGRLTGRIGDYSIGALNMQSQDDLPSKSPATNFTALRLKRNVLKRSYVGVLYTGRNETASNGRPTGETFGLDGLYSLSTALNVNAYYAKTQGAAESTGNTSYLARFDYNADRYGVQVERLKVGELFDPQVGFLRRSDFVRSYAMARFSPRPNRNHWKAIRKFNYAANMEYIENNQGRVDLREPEGSFSVDMANSDSTGITLTRDYEFIPKAFAISPGVIVPVGGYTYQNLSTSYTLGTQHMLSGTLSFQQGSLYGGTKQTVGLGAGRMEVTPQIALEPGASINWVRLPYGHFTTTVLTERTTYTITPRMFVSALTQYASNSHTFSSNARFRWEYRPGSELFVVYSDGRDTTVAGFPSLVNQAFIVKINRLFRM